MRKKKITIGIVCFFLIASFLLSPRFGANITVTQVFLDGSITIDPMNPNGNNGWYVTPVDVTFHAHDPHKIVVAYTASNIELLL